MRRNNTTEPLIGEIVLEPVRPAPIALVTLAAELPDLSIGELLGRLGPDEVFTEPQTGLRCVSVETCRRVIDEQAEGARRRARMSAEAEQRMILAALPKSTRYVADEHLEGLAASAFKGARP